MTSPCLYCGVSICFACSLPTTQRTFSDVCSLANAQQFQFWFAHAICESVTRSACFPRQLMINYLIGVRFNCCEWFFCLHSVCIRRYCSRRRRFADVLPPRLPAVIAKRPLDNPAPAPGVVGRRLMSAAIAPPPSVKLRTRVDAGRTARANIVSAFYSLCTLVICRHNWLKYKSKQRHKSFTALEQETDTT